MTLNVMMDASPMFPVPYHPVSEVMKRDYTGLVKHRSRTARPVRYYWTDFGLSRRYSPDDLEPAEVPIWGGDRSVPEYLEDIDSPRNPFPVDVYVLGNLVKEDFLEVRLTATIRLTWISHLRPQKYSNLRFMDGLIASMTNGEPSKRPTMAAAVADLEKIISKLPQWRLRSRLVSREDKFFTNLVKDIYRVVVRAPSQLFRPPIPTPKAVVAGS